MNEKEQEDPQQKGKGWEKERTGVKSYDGWFFRGNNPVKTNA
jgi:hypothetical protein